MNRWLSYILCNGIFASMLYLGLIEGMTGAANAALFIAWWTIVMAILMTAIAKEKVIAHWREKPSPVPMWVDWTFDMAVCLLMAWHGWWVTVAFYAIHTLLLAGLKADASKPEPEAA